MKKYESLSRVVPWFAALLLSGLVAACGGGADSILGASGVAPAGKLPTVTMATPLSNATAVPVNTKVISAIFSKAMDPATLTAATFSLACPVGVSQAGAVGYSASANAATLTLANVLPANTPCKATITTGAKDATGVALASDFAWTFTTGGASGDVTAPTIVLVNPADLATGVAVNSAVRATFDEAMDPLTINTANFLVAGITGAVVYDATNKIAIFTPSGNLVANTTYTATVKGAPGGVKDLAGNPLVLDKVWQFKTAINPAVLPLVTLGSVAPFGTFGGSAGMTNMGIYTVVKGDIGTISTTTATVTGFHDAFDIYTETPSNIGTVTGSIYSCTNSTTGPTSVAPNPASCLIATNARLDAQVAYLALAAMPAGANPGANLANLTLAPGVYTSPSGSFLIEGGNLTLDAQGDANAVWVFQMAQTLTVGGPGAAAPQSIILAGGAQAKNIYWQVGSFATINAGGGGTMMGTIIAQAGASFSTSGNVAKVTLEGRAVSLGASVTLVNTVINVPAP